EARTLRAVAAILRTRARLDREQRADLHRVRIELFPMHALRVEDQIGERQREQRLDFGERPVGADLTQTMRRRLTCERGGRRGHFSYFHESVRELSRRKLLTLVP